MVLEPALHRNDLQTPGHVAPALLLTPLLGIVRTVGGTSASSPTFAAVIALVNDALIAAGRPALGWLNPWIYGGAYHALTDITSGSSIGCNSSGFPAEVGWDAVTGYGTPVSRIPSELAISMTKQMLTKDFVQNLGKLIGAAFHQGKPYSK